MQRAARLTDLDELAERVRDPASRDYLVEAIDAHRGGAQRAAIVATWVALTYDLMQRIRELAALGDAQAVYVAAEVDCAIANNHVPKLLEIERHLLETARDKFQLISPHEFQELARLRDDRHLCAHPAFVSEDALFQPSPEAARAHIVHTVNHVLQHPPVQGRSALDRMMADIKSATFPKDADSVYEFLHSKYLKRAKEVLVRNATLAIVKALLVEEDPAAMAHAADFARAVYAIGLAQPAVYRSVLQKSLPGIVERVSDGNFGRILTLLGADSQCWQWMGEPGRLRVKQFASSLDLASASSEQVSGLLQVDELVLVLMGRMGQLSPGEVSKLVSEHPEHRFFPLVLKTYEEARSYREAETIGQLAILPLGEDLTVGEVKSALGTVQKNRQIYEAAGTGGVLLNLYELTKKHRDAAAEDWNRLRDFLGEKSPRTAEDLIAILTPS